MRCQGPGVSSVQLKLSRGRTQGWEWWQVLPWLIHSFIQPSPVLGISNTAVTQRETNPCPQGACVLEGGGMRRQTINKINKLNKWYVR